MSKGEIFCEPVFAPEVMSASHFVDMYRRHGSVKAVGRVTGSYFKAKKWYYKAVEEGLMAPIPTRSKTREEIKDPEIQIVGDQGRVHARETRELGAPTKGIRRFLFSCAQNNTKVHAGFWKSLQTLAKHYDAEIHIARFTYVKAGLGALGDKAAVISKKALYGGQEMWWDPQLVPYFSDERLEVGPGLVWCGEMNTLPTAVRPLSGLEVYTGRKSGIFPHVKLAMESIPSSKYEPPKFNYTTGAVTLRNYIQRKAGLKAEFHHCYGALLVEVDAEGDWFCRQINADSEGVIHDLDVRVDGDAWSFGNPVEAITWGDVHVAQLEPWVRELSWGTGGILDTLQPKHQFLHDVLDWRSRSHHEMKDPHRMFKRFRDGDFIVESELYEVALFLEDAWRPWCQNIIVHSNHHDHLGRWLKEQDGRFDPINAVAWARLNQAVYETMNRFESVNYLKISMELFGTANLFQYGYTYLDSDESFVLCHDKAGGIECGAHGHSGPNGSRGSPKGFARQGRKANIGHFHSAGILDGIYVSGTCSKLAADWTTGASSWSHTHTVTYPNGKRALITCWNRKWRA
jgi:hypothetical protein